MKIFFNSFLKVFGFFSAILAILVIAGLISNFIIKNNSSQYFSYLSGPENSKKTIAILNLNGPIISNPTNQINFNLLNYLDAIYPNKIELYLHQLKKEKISGLVVSIDSQGGAVSPTKKIFDLFKEFKNNSNIPIYFHSNNLMVSGAYWISLSGNKIFSSYGALIGSIGVKGPDWIYFNSPTSLSTGVLGSYVESPNGIEMYSNTAGFSKDIFNPFRKPNKNEQIKLQEMVEDIYDDFITNVSANRKIEKNIIKNEIGAMIYNSKQAKKIHLIDNQQDLDQTVESLKNTLKIKSPRIISNTGKLNSNILKVYFNSILNIYDKNIENNKIIKYKFCNNLKNEFSSATNNLFNYDC